MLLTIGSGDVYRLMAGLNTQSYQSLLRQFVAENRPYYNAQASPIDALRTGSIIEERYTELVGADFFVQYKARCKEMDCFISTLDFAQLKDGEVINFEELKSIFITDFIDIVVPITDMSYDEYIQVIKKKFKKYYEQVQFQLLCTGLDSAILTFISISSYVDEENWTREIQGNEVAKFDIKRDEDVILKLKERGSFFQSIRDHFTQL